VFDSGSLLTYISLEEMETPGEVFKGVPRGADPLEVIVPQFLVRAIAQSTCLSGATNLLTLTLMTNIDLCAQHSVSHIIVCYTPNSPNLIKPTKYVFAQASIYVTPITGAKASTPVLLLPVDDSHDVPDLFWDAKSRGFNSSGRWGCGSCAYETLHLDLRPGQVLLANVSYKLRAVVRNPRSDEWELPQAHALLAPLSVGATGSFSPIPLSPFIISSDPRDAVPNGSQPMRVLEPYFSVMRIGQSTTAQGALNMITVTLQSPFPLRRNSSITLSGLLGASAADGEIRLQDAVTGASNCSAMLTGRVLASCAGHFAARGAEIAAAGVVYGAGSWSNDSSTLVVFVRNGTLADEHLVVSFNVTNPPHGQAAPRPSVQASIFFLSV